jgi:hypothetical protein
MKASIDNTSRPRVFDAPLRASKNKSPKLAISNVPRRVFLSFPWASRDLCDNRGYENVFAGDFMDDDFTDQTTPRGV